MKSHVLESFDKLYAVLPSDIQKEARKAYRQFKRDPNHPGLHFKSVTGKDGRLYQSARIGKRYRALGLLRSGEIYWFWIGPHAEYDKLLA